MYRAHLLAIAAICGLLYPTQFATAATPVTSRSAVGHSIKDFNLKDLQGVTHSLGELRDAPVVGVIFMGVECPLAKLYAPRLTELADEFAARGVALLAIDSNSQDSLAEMQHFARTYGLKIPFLKDPGNVVADQFDAERTPEVFLLDRERKVCYRGRIDDQYGFQSGVGYQRPVAAKRDMAEAISQLLAGQPVSEPSTRAPGCLIGRVHAAKEGSEVTYSKQIARLFQDRCVSCHREGEIAPFSLTDYSEVVGWAPMIAETVRENRMPPWHASPEFGHFSNDSRLTDAEKQMIATWVDNGAPQGDPRDLPAPRQFTSGWQIAQPDRVVAMADKPYTVPAEGKVEYQYFVADPGLTEDIWVTAAECRPGNNAVVHHIIVFIVPPGEEAKQMGEGMGARDLLAGTAPGNPPMTLPTGMAKRIKAGSKFLFQMHYTANGTEQQDLSKIGLVLADPATVTREVKTDLAINTGFNIPAGCSDQQVESWHTFSRDTLILSYMPHMHLRGSAFRYDLQYPDGKVVTLLDIPKYDFNWQNNYDLAEPLLVPKGAKMRCIAHFDNSADNLANPDSTVAVGWGEQTWEEMMIGWFVKATAEETPNLPAVLVAKEKAREERRAEMRERRRAEREAKAAANTSAATSTGDGAESEE